MDINKTTYSSFPFEWTIKSTSHQILYRKAFNTNEIDEIFCSIINAKENVINFSELGGLLGFNLQDLAETDILNIYLKSIAEYNLITINEDIICLTELGQEALQNKLKYKYLFASTELFENQPATGESFNFSFSSVFDLKNELILTHKENTEERIYENPELKSKLQFQLFEDDIYKGEIIKLYESNTYISYKRISLQCETYALDSSFQLSIHKSGIDKPDIQFLIDLPENKELRSKLIRKGMYHHILSDKDSITVQDIETYIDLWNWKELAENPKTDWHDKNIFKLFIENGEGSIWSTISQKAPIKNIKLVIQEYAEYWNWTTLTERFEDDFIKEEIENFNWDFEELSYKKTELVTSLLLNLSLKDRDWDWNYLSKNLPDEFIENHIDDFAWDFYIITEEKSTILRNILSKGKKSNSEYGNILLSKPWNWKFISEKFRIEFLYEQKSIFAEKIDWQTILNRFFTNAEISAKCVIDESFKLLLKQHLPKNFIIAHQKYLWTLDIIDFFEEQNLIQWETESYIQGFDTNDNVEWSKLIFEKYHNRITTNKGFLAVSQQISDYSLIEEFSNFPWNWEGLSSNKKVVNETFVEWVIQNKPQFVDNLVWSEILTNSSFDSYFWNNNNLLESLFSLTDSEKQKLFWGLLTQKNSYLFILKNHYYPWDWQYITKYSFTKDILDNLKDDKLVRKWDWEIATRKFDKEDIVNNLEDFANYIDWKFLINEVFTIENELAMDKQLPRIAACLSVIDEGKQKDVWKVLTAKYPFEMLFNYVQLTHKLKDFKWDWDFISVHKFFPTDIETLSQYSSKINWTILSNSNAIQQKFNPSNWEVYKEWLNNIDQYLSKFADFWDWTNLSKNRNVTYNRFILSKYKNEKWDWKYLSEFGGFLIKQNKDNDKYLAQLVKRFPRIKFEFLSKRKDITIDSDFILLNKDKNWDWQMLSENDKAEITIELILELKAKNWDWGAISKRKNIDFTNQILLQLLDKDWDWAYLSENSNLVFDTEFIEKTKTKSWNWKTVSQNNTFLPTFEILSLTNDFDLDWEHLSKHPKLTPTKKLLAEFETKWDWKYITKNEQINFNDIDFIERFVHKWDWHFICDPDKNRINNQILTKFKKHLHWDLVSTNNNLNFSKEIIQEFRPYWNWAKLKENNLVKELLGNYIADEISKSPILTFIDKIEQQYSPWRGYIYHFSHIDNAVDIIKNRKIQSRNKARIKGDAAGNVVHLRNDAHDYARFYFRPHTPTQFYNEFLGKNSTDNYYEKARSLGFPKCPLPIFFRFSLKEVLFNNENNCSISNGNMQKRATQFNPISQMLNKFNFEYLYSDIDAGVENYMNFSQQEFLVKDELSFNNLSNFEIVCPSETERALLINLLGQEYKDIYSKIAVNARYYNNENPRVNIRENESQLHISSNYKGIGYFKLNVTSGIREINILSGDVSKIDKGNIIFSSYITLGKIEQNLQLNFIDESDRNWFIYSKGALKSDSENKTFSSLWKNIITSTVYNPTEAITLLKQHGYDDTFSHKIRHYKLEAHTTLVCKIFEKYFVEYIGGTLSLELFRTLLILHDIGKTKAFKEGNKNNQYLYSQQIINTIWVKLSFTDEELSIVLSLLENDYIGEFFQNRLTLENCKDIILKLAESCRLKAYSFFKAYMIYYQCDTASYTADEGGIKFLEDLFEYNNNRKVFDNTEGLMKMSPKYWEMYKQLKYEIVNANNTY